ncbi:hypothetical protein [Hymenobacter metallicola]|uniref:Uncharacterized protein n=1 Tax=Hymenobacter metallicola TaxID=2563114 RepID=A0A4Z0QGD4_9BACT|nr:hypothetical protein [Hymenobacter metallicola]TGE29087.1 hypothetical protein E5K02_06425 [Hymenobacter metallicola]
MDEFRSPAVLAAQFVPLVLLAVVVWYGTLRRHLGFFALVLAAVAGLVLGLLFKIMHWAGTSAVLIGSSAVLVAGYASWFARKPAKIRLDGIKLAFIICLSAWGIAQGLYARPALPWISSALTVTFWALLLDFGYVTFIRRRENVQTPPEL